MDETTTSATAEHHVVPVHEAIEARAQEAPADVFVRSIATDNAITFGEFERVTARFGAWLGELGIGPGDRVAVLAENTIECVIAFLGAQRVGVTVCPVNTEVNSANVSRILYDVDPKLVVYSENLADVAAQHVDAADHARFVQFGRWDDPSPAPDTLFALIAPFADAKLDPPAGSFDSEILVCYTSGTTDRPRGVIHTRSSSAHQIRASIEMTGVARGDKLLEFRSLSWVSAQVVSMGAAIHSGATVVLAPKFSRSAFFRWLRDEGITIAIGVPTVINMLLEDTSGEKPEIPPTLRYMTSSSAPLSIDRHREFEDRYGIKIMQYYGMSEAGWMAGNHYANRKLGTVGTPTLFQRLRIEGPDGQTLPAGEEGEIVVGGEQMAIGYLMDRDTIVPIPDRTSFHTGDLGRLDEDGFLTVTGRLKDIVIRGGVNIAPMEITTALLSHPGVSDAATVGVPDRVYGEAVVSFVTLRDPAVSVDDIRKHLESRLSDYKMPSEILVLDEIPKTDRGKTANDALRAIWSERSEEGAS